MTQNTLPSIGLSEQFSDLVAQSAMELPPLTRPEDMEFLRSMLAVAIEAFWVNYLSLQPDHVQEEYAKAQEAETGDALLNWMQKHADFAGNPIARATADKVLSDLRERFPAVMQAEYPSFQPDNP